MYIHPIGSRIFIDKCNYIKNRKNRNSLKHINYGSSTIYYHAVYIIILIT